MAKIDLKIDGAENARGIIATGWPTQIVTLLGKTDAHRVPCSGDHHLCLYFDDTERHNDTRYAAASPWHVQRVLEHTAALEDGDTLLIHCKAGKSRSTAIALAVMIQHGMTPEEAFTYVQMVRDILIPNRMIVEFIDDHFGLNGELNSIVADYYERLTLPGIRLPDRGGWNQ